MTERIIIRVEASEKDQPSTVFVKLFMLLPVLVAFLASGAVDVSAVPTLKSILAVQGSLERQLSFGLVAVILFSIFFLRMIWSRRDAARNLEFIVTIFPLGVQLSQPGRKGGFIPRDRIVDCRIQEIIQAHRVYSSPRLVCKSRHDAGAVETVELFPELELSYMECDGVCRKLRKILGLTKNADGSRVKVAK